MNYSVYVLRSLRNSRVYVGLTGKDVRQRLKEHNQGSNRFTSRNRPLELIYFEEGYCRKCASRRERYLKSGKGKQLISFILGFSVPTKGGSTSG